MSKYCNYDEKCNQYDSGRQAVAADVITGLMVTHCGKDKKDIKVLDAGCGTGNYAVELLRHGIQQVSLIDGSQGMLSTARTKITKLGLSNDTDFKLAKLPIVPYENETFDAVLINQVLHHLVSNEEVNDIVPITTKCLSELKRVLKPNGLLVITYSTQEQINGIWYYHLNPKTLDSFINKYDTNPQIKSILLDLGFEIIGNLNVLGNNIIKRYTDFDAPFCQKFRDTDSFWGYMSEEELASSLDRLKSLKEAGQQAAFFAKHDKTKDIGYFGILVAKAISN